jgi:hypothetical protein
MDRSGRLATHLVVSIASGTALAAAPIDLSDYAIAGIIMPSAWDTAAITFQASATKDGTYSNLYDDGGTEVAITSANAVAGRAIVNKTILEQLAGLRWVKFRSGTAGSPVNQSATRSITVLLKS